MAAFYEAINKYNDLLISYAFLFIEYMHLVAILMIM